MHVAAVQACKSWVCVLTCTFLGEKKRKKWRCGAWICLCFHCLYRRMYSATRTRGSTGKESWFSVLVTPTEHLLQCKVCKGDDIRQEDHLIYAGGSLIMSSVGAFGPCGLLRLSLTLIAGLFCCIITVGVPQQRLDIGLCESWGSQGLSSGGLQPQSCWRGWYVRITTSAETTANEILLPSFLTQVSSFISSLEFFLL